MSGLQPLDDRVYPDVAPGDDRRPAPKCFTETCEMLATGQGSGLFACEHEHITTEAEFCAACWIERRYAKFTWHCSRCYGWKPGKREREEWGHFCPMTLVLPGGRISS